MTVAELIEILRNLPPTAKVWAQSDEGSFPIYRVREIADEVVLED